ncbi:cysteine-rich secreted protein [Aspergillus clavatus NRRL 1]|uniref:Cysteine-rich secreted protein n=1 Tax=Aspergillus clavatus (strain ATCC 1007 / CBS 513.65 / DSM 816 / NCTC 3887 / NRRL 1 / QM 1276 / 107) TaxID=344612 RepID=A1CGC8_ASPCL|nr:cysteine-rich secreted protein [Aspergillus clavatus NRRL 1]EAW11008.1 cysteine-rich secreted protein [Aspergillus clavatus NRRL 1]
MSDSYPFPRSQHRKTLTTHKRVASSRSSSFSSSPQRTVERTEHIQETRRTPYESQIESTPATIVTPDTPDIPATPKAPEKLEAPVNPSTPPPTHRQPRGLLYKSTCFIMMLFSLGLVAILLQISPLEAKLYRQNVLTFEVSPDAKITGQKIEYNDPDCDPGMHCVVTKTCAAPGTGPTLSGDKKYFACCLAGQHLLGSADTAFDCCADGHDLAGSKATGYHCCPKGFDFDGVLCKQVCQNGKKLVNGKCACAEGTEEAQDGTCHPKRDIPGVCHSGLESGKLGSLSPCLYARCTKPRQGKCYTFTAENGNRLGLRNDNVYYAAPDSMVQRYGKFQLCIDEKCTPGKTINPSDKSYIRDMYGDLATGANKGQWLNNAQNGAHIGRTPNFALAGQFALSKWPCGKYCLGGFAAGIGPACPAEVPAMTFYSQDPQMCVPFDLTEVPCDIRDNANNCIWKNGDQCCNKVDCAWKPLAGKA